MWEYLFEYLDFYIDTNTSVTQFIDKKNKYLYSFSVLKKMNIQ